MSNNQLTTNFHLREFKCNDGTEVPCELLANIGVLAAQLQVIRDFLSEQYKDEFPNGVRLTLVSAYRTDSYNEKVGGSPKSQHKKAKAGDLVSEVLSPKQLSLVIKKLIKEKKIIQGGVGLYPSFVHYDTRGTEARW